MSKNWQKIEELFHRAADLSPADRGPFLAAECGDDEAVRSEVEALLSADDSGKELPRPFFPAALMPGRQIGRFEILSLCGRGSSGTVYLARDTRSERKLAIKVFEQFLLPEQRRRYLKEVRAASVLRHPNIVAFEEVGRFEDRDFLVMEHVEGRTLGESIPKGGMPVAVALNLARMLVDGLVAAHAQGVIHRDLKPSNVMLTSEGTIKVLDFGLAKLIDLTGDEARAASLGTVSGQIVGTACYLSPEQARGEAVDERTDIFSLGALLYEMLTGTKPFDRGSLAGTLSAILRDAPIPVRELRRETPRDVARLVRRCLEKNRDSRFRSVDEVLRALLQCIAGLKSKRRLVLDFIRRREVAATMLTGLLLLVSGAALVGIRALNVRKARNVIEPQIKLLVQQRHYNAADELASRIETIVPASQTVRDFIRDYRIVTSVVTEPAGAETR